MEEQRKTGIFSDPEEEVPKLGLIIEDEVGSDQEKFQDLFIKGTSMNSKQIEVLDMTIQEFSNQNSLVEQSLELKNFNSPTASIEQSVIIYNNNIKEPQSQKVNHFSQSRNPANRVADMKERPSI